MPRTSSSSLAGALALAALVAVARAQPNPDTNTGNQYYKSPQYPDGVPRNYAVQLALLRGGAGEPLAIDCVVGNGSTCINANNAPPPTASVPAGDAIVISWAPNPFAAVGPPTDAPGATMTIRACYAKYSVTDRPWRKNNPKVKKNLQKNCNIKVTSGDVGPTPSSYTWELPDSLPPALLQVQVLQVCKNASTGNEWYCGFGQSNTSTFNVTPVDSRPTWLLVCSYCFIGIGPVVGVLFFVWESKTKKRA